MNLTEFFHAVKDDLAAKLTEGIKDVGYEGSLDVLVANYRKFCIAFAKRYLDRQDTDPEILHAFREKFVSMMKLTAITLDEIDAYVVGRYVDKTGRVLEIYQSAKDIRMEVKKFVKKGAKR